MAAPFDTVGFLSRDLPTLRSALAAGVDRQAEQVLPAGAAIHTVLVPDDILSEASDETREQCIELARGLAGANGISIRNARLGWLCSAESSELFTRLQGRAIWREHRLWLIANESYLASEVRARLRWARSFARADDDDLARDRRLRRDYVDRLREIVEDGCAVVVLPIMRDLSPLKSAGPKDLASFRQSAVAFAVPASLSGSPQVVSPVRSAAGVRRCVGLLGPPGSDRDLLRMLPDEPIGSISSLSG